MDIAVVSLLDKYVGWIVDRPPLEAGLVGLLVGLAICPGYMYLLGLLSEGRWLRYKDQFRAFMPGDLLGLGPAFGAACYLAARFNQAGNAPFFDAPVWAWIAAGFGTSLVVMLGALDIMGAMRHTPGDADTYSWAQLTSWTKLYHNIFVYGVYGCLLVGLGVPGLGWAPWLPVLSLDNLARLVMLAALGFWIAMLGVDAKHPKHKTAHVEMDLRTEAGQLRWVIGLMVMVFTVIPLALA